MKPLFRSTMWTENAGSSIGYRSVPGPFGHFGRVKALFGQSPFAVLKCGCRVNVPFGNAKETRLRVLGELLVQRCGTNVSGGSEPSFADVVNAGMVSVACRRYDGPGQSIACIASM
eukprot:3557898-Rhodomonas_salina.2